MANYSFGICPPMLLHIYNYSKIFGGQERYVESIIAEFNRRKIPSYFTGNPIRFYKFISAYSESLDRLCLVELLNGNRSLYLRAWRPKFAAIRIYVQHSHIDDAQSYFLKKWVRRLLLKVLLLRVDVVIRVCQHALPEWFAPGKVHTVYNGISIPPLDTEPKLPRPFTLLMVGAVNDNKNQILALRLLAEQADLRLILVGDGPRLKEWQQWACEACIDSRVSWTGFVDAPEQYYGQADTLLLLSEFEAFPYVMLEAMAHALPVVATRVGGIPEAITHEKDGLLLPRRDLNALSDAVSQLKNNRDWATQLGQQARITVSERFTAEKMTDNLLALIESAARKKALIQ
jgi:L-malate glycosyltransferase